MSDTDKIALGFILPPLTVIGLIAVTNALHIHAGEADGFFFSEAIILPMLMGFMNAWFWRDLEMSTRRTWGYNFINCLISSLMAFFVLREGAICLLIVSPLVCCFVMIGFAIGNRVLKKDNNQLNVSVVLLLLVVFIADVFSKHEYENVVADTIVINAPPAKVWKNVVAFEPIKAKPKYWLFKAGLPNPIAATVTGYCNGAGRKCIFSTGYTIGEQISTFDPRKDLTFDIISQPRDPEMMNHLDLLKGQFLLKDNGNGTTTVTGTSWYRLHVFPAWYYDLWAQSIVRNVHVRVMEHIKELSEKNNGTTFNISPIAFTKPSR